MAAKMRTGDARTPRLRLAILLAAGLAVLLLAPGIARASCEHNLPKIGYLGITDLDCDCTTNISVSSKNGRPTIRRIWTFRSEPTVGQVKSSGPSHNKLKAGDVITAVDGALITTREGSSRFSSLTPGRVVTFTVRRDERDIHVPVTVGEICPEELSGSFSVGELTAPRAPEPPDTPHTPMTAPTPETPATPRVAPTSPTPSPFRGYRRAAPRADFDSPVFTPEALPKGWLGVGLSCQECGGERKDEAQTPVWYFGTIPTISFVDPEGPSARAGLRRGDQLTHIDGVPLVSVDGGKKFGAVRPGQRIRWRVIRDGKPTTIAVTAVQRPGEEVQALGDLSDQLKALGDSKLLRLDSREMQGLMKELRQLENVTPQPQAQTQAQTQRRLRYSGAVGGSDVEVRGLGNVVVDDSGDEIVITTRDATIRIRPGQKPRVERRKDRDQK